METLGEARYREATELIKGAKDAGSKVKESISPLDLCMLFSCVENTKDFISEKNRVSRQLLDNLFWLSVCLIPFSLVYIEESKGQYVAIVDGFISTMFLLRFIGSVYSMTCLLFMNVENLRSCKEMSKYTIPWIVATSMVTMMIVFSILSCISTEYSMLYLGMLISYAFHLAWYWSDCEISTMKLSIDMRPDNTPLPVEPKTIREDFCKKCVQEYEGLIEWVKRRFK